MIKQQSESLLFLSITFILLIGIILQTQIYMSHDVAWHILITERLLQGGHYKQNFMDISPPIIMYSKIPVIYLMNLLKLSMSVSLRLYMFTISCLSLFLCYQVLNTLRGKELFFRNALMISLSFSFFCLPLYELGQRDNMVMVLVMPYFLTFLDHPFKAALPLKLRILTSIFAGIGFLVHAPYFLIFISLESYFFYTQKRKRLLEIGLITCITIIYLLLITFLSPDYFNFVLPLVLWGYIDIYNRQWIEILGSLTALGVYFTLLTFFVIKKSAHFNYFLKMMAYLLVVFFISYVLTKKLWYYHKLPTLTLTIVVLTCLLEHALQTKKKLTIYLVVSLFIFPMLEFTTILKQSQQLKKTSSPLSQVINYVKKNHSTQNIYVFSATMWPQTLIPYAHVNIASRFSPTWLPLAIIKKQSMASNQAEQEKITEMKNYLFKTMSDDLLKYQPSLILVDDSLPDTFSKLHFNFIPFFQQDPTFSDIWKHYELSGTLFDCRIYIRRQ